MKAIPMKGILTAWGRILLGKKLAQGLLHADCSLPGNELRLVAVDGQEQRDRIYKLAESRLQELRREPSAVAARGGHGCSIGGAPAFEQLCGYRVGGLHRLQEPRESWGDRHADVSSQSSFSYVDGSGCRGLF